MGKLYVLLALSFAATLLISSEAEQCGSQAGGALCPGSLCCSQWGWCGTTALHCDPAQGCQSQCWGGPAPSPPPLSPSPPPPSPPPSSPSPPPPSPPPSPPSAPPPPGGGGDGDLGSIITQSLFDQMLKHRNDDRCPAKNFYTYDAFIAAAKAFGDFGTTGSLDTRKREIAAFFGQTSHETFGGWPEAPDGPFAWGYCHKEEVNKGDYCEPSTQWPCAPGKQYYGRGPIQLSWNYNYGQAGRDLGAALLNNPDLVAADPVMSFKAALWFWMTPQPPKPSCHDVITERWKPSAADLQAGRVPGYGVITNIINGGLECGHGTDPRVANRIAFYKRYSDMLGVTPGDNLDCYSQRPFGLATHLKLSSAF